MARTVNQRLQTAIVGDATKLRRAFDDAGRAADDLADRTEQIGPRSRTGFRQAEGAASGFFDKLGTLLKGSVAAAGTAGIAIGGAVAAGLGKGLADALDREAQLDLVTARLGGERGELAGKIAGELYVSAWGESIEANGAVVSTVISRMGDRINADLAKSLSAQSIDLGRVLGEDGSRVVSVGAQLEATGLAGSMQEALDMIAKGQTLGLNENGELLDTLNEYAAAFTDLGLTGEQALGLLNQGLEGGAFNIDKVGDAFNEFSTRVLDQSKGSREALGLLFRPADVDFLERQFARGGDAAATATGQVLDQLRAMGDTVEREAAGVALFGSMWEDLGADVILGLDPAKAALIEFDGAASDLSDTINDNLSTRLEALKRRGFDALATVAATHLMPVLEKVVAFMEDDLGPIVERVTTAFDRDGLGGVWALVVDQWEKAWPTIRKWVGDTVSSIAKWLGDKWPEVARKGVELWVQARSWIIDSLPDWLRALGELFDRVTDWFERDGLPKLSTWLENEGVPALVKWIGESWSGQGGMQQELVKLLGEMGRWVATEGVRKTFTIWGDIGAAVINGISVGIFGTNVSGIFDKIEREFVLAINRIIEVWNGLDFTLPDWLGGGTPGVPDVTPIAVPPAPPINPEWPDAVIHSGGTFVARGGRREGLALLETGERVLPRSRSGHGDGIHLHFHGPVSRDSISWVAEQVRAAQRRGDLAS